MKLLKKTKKLSKTVIIIYALFTVVLFRAIIVNALENFGNYYRLNTTSYTGEYKFDITGIDNKCVVVTGTFTGNDIFVPKATTGEWDNFRRTHTPGYISINTGIVPGCDNNHPPFYSNPRGPGCLQGSVHNYTGDTSCKTRECWGDCGEKTYCDTGTCM